LPNEKLTVRGEDVVLLVEKLSQKGKKCVGLTGEDLYFEYKLKNPLGGSGVLARVPWKPKEGDLFSRPSLCLLGPQGKKLKDLGKTLTVAVNAKYARTAERYLKNLGKKGYSFEMLILNGCTEEAAKNGLADLVVDIVLSGRSAQEAGLRVYDRLMESDAVLVGVKE